MVVERLPVVILPSGRVPGRVLLVLPILEARRRRNRDEIAQKSSRPEGFEGRSKYMPKEGTRRGSEGPGAPWLPSGPALVLREASCTLIFPVFFPEFLEHF